MTQQQILKKQHIYQQSTQKYVEDPYKHRDFPKWKYHPEKSPMLVNNADEENSLEPGWQDKPIPNSAPSKEEALRRENEYLKKQLAALKKE